MGLVSGRNVSARYVYFGLRVVEFFIKFFLGGLCVKDIGHIS